MFDIAYDTVVFVVGITAVMAALGVIICSSPIYSALFLIGHMICLALLFLLYNAEFLAAVQIIVYAGAVMILFIFIIALLGGKKEVQEPSAQKGAAFTFIFLLLGELFLAATIDKTQTVKAGIGPEVVAAVGNAKAVGMELFSRHLIPFELASALLLVAAVGIVCLAKFPNAPKRKETR